MWSDKKSPNPTYVSAKVSKCHPATSVEAQNLALAWKGHFCEKMWEGCTVIPDGTATVSPRQRVWALGRSIISKPLANAPSSVASQHNSVPWQRGTSADRGLWERCMAAAPEHPARQESCLSGVGHSLCHPLLKREVRYLFRSGFDRVWSGLCQAGRVI